MHSGQEVYRFKCDHCGVETQWRFGDGAPTHRCVIAATGEVHWHVADVPEGTPTAEDVAALLSDEQRDKNKVHTQAIPLAVWTVNHDMGKKPTVDVFDSLGRQIWGGEVDHLSDDLLTITFGAALAGEAHLN